MRSYLLFCLFFCLTSSIRSAENPRILYLGDSLSLGAFGRTLNAGLRDEGVDLYFISAGGTNPRYWLKSFKPVPCTIGYWEKTPTTERKIRYIGKVPKMEDVIADFAPDVVAVQTGINLYATLRSKRNPREENRRIVAGFIRQMCESIEKSGARSYWVLPPHSHERRYSTELQNELAGIIRSVAQESNSGIFESAEVTRFTDPYPKTDGIHYGPTEATEWANKVWPHLYQFAQSAGKRQEITPPPPAGPAPEPEKVTEVIPPPATLIATAERIKETKPEPAKTEAAKPKTKKKTDDGTKVFDLLDLDLRLVGKTEIKDTSQIDYANALGVFEYEVLNSRDVDYPYKKIRVAHGVVFGRRLTGVTKRKLGAEIGLRLVPLDRYETLRSWQTVDDLPIDFDMPLYTPKL